MEADNRLAMLDWGSSSMSSLVRFSDAGVPETFGANNYVDLTPGDGEHVNRLVAWGGDLYAFKDTKSFVFYGNSVDSSGNPVFNYRTVAVGAGLASGAAHAIAPEGIYFLDGSKRNVAIDVKIPRARAAPALPSPGRWQRASGTRLWAVERDRH
jgi:hypothetical protein